MGVSGCGKSTVGSRLAELLGIAFLEGDDFHPESNRKKMSSGKSLNDLDRQPWLERLNIELRNHPSCVLSCSALKGSYRDLLTADLDSYCFVHLEGKFDLIYERMKNRSSHFMPASLLQSQFDVLERPTQAYHIDISHSIDDIIKIATSQITMNKSKIGLLGLGVMGKSLARNIADKGNRTSVYNLPFPGEEGVVNEFVGKFQELPFYGASDLQDFVDSLDRPRMIILMIKAGEAVDEMIGKLKPLLDENDMIVDAGNSFYKDTQRREAEMKSDGFHFVGMGVSGGEEGALYGPSIMPAGTAYAQKYLLPVLRDIAAKAEAEPCVQWVGPDGAGHFVKMIHNGIEYADMQLISELYEVCRKVFGLTNAEIADFFESFDSIHKGYLLEISTNILRKKEDNNYVLDTILDVAGHKGTGMWTSREALEMGIAVPTITAAMNQRIISSYKELRRTLGSSPKSNMDFTADWQQSLENGFLMARMQAHIEGFHLIQAASDKNGWNIDMASVSSLWRGGCIIRSAMLPVFMKSFSDGSSIEHLYRSKTIMSILQNSINHAVAVNSLAQENSISTPCFSAAIQYFMSVTTRDLPINMIQAQRDYFGAHTYRTNEDPDTPRHTIWS